MSCVRRPYFQDSAETIHFIQRGQIKFDPRSVNHCLIMKERDREREGDWHREMGGKGRGETVLEKRGGGGEWNKTGTTGEKEGKKKIIQRDSSILYGWEVQVSCILRHNRG